MASLGAPCDIVTIAVCSSAEGSESVLIVANAQPAPHIPRSKRLSHQDERRPVGQILTAVLGAVADESADEAQSTALRKGRMRKLKAFRKSLDRVGDGPCAMVAGAK
jgi:hypothetical protein